MNKSIFISGLLLTLALGSCYKDKGNYGYKDVNDFEVTVTPAPADKETNIYLVNQPGATTETFLLTAPDEIRTINLHIIYIYGVLVESTATHIVL